MARKTSSRLPTEADPNFGWFDLLKALWRFLGRNRLAFVFWAAVMAAVSAVALLPAYLIGRIVDFFTAYEPGADLTPFYALAVAYGLIYAVNSLVRLQAKKYMAGIEIDTVYSARVEGFERLMDFSLSWHNHENAGNKIQRIQTGIDDIRAIMRSVGGPFFKIFIQLAGIMLVFLAQGSVILAFICIYVAVVLILEKTFYARMRDAQIANSRTSEDSSGTYFESTANLLTIKALGLKEGVKAKVQEKEKAAKDTKLAIRQLGLSKWQFFQVWNGFALCVFIILVGHRFVDGLITLGLIFTLYNYFMRFIDAISDATDIFVDFTEYSAGISRMMPIYKDADGYRGTQSFPKEWESIKISDARFAYQVGEGEIHVNGLSMEIPRGGKVGIAGKTGSGKSTLIKLLLGLYPLDSGTITVGSASAKDIKHDELTRHMATVLQETELFNLSLRDNLTLFKAVPEALLEKAVRIAQLEELIAKLPQGLDSHIGEKGYRLSGGERQRLGIARAICADTEILIFDEATSALDSKTEALIQEALEKELTGKTLVVIAHRLSTLKGMDRIYVFKDGTVAEEGSFDELLEIEAGIFKESYALQVRGGQA